MEKGRIEFAITSLELKKAWIDRRRLDFDKINVNLWKAKISGGEGVNSVLTHIMHLFYASNSSGNYLYFMIISFFPIF